MRSYGVWRFGVFEVDPTNRTLVRNGERVALQPKAFDILTILLKNAAELVTRKELFQTVWPDTEVEDANLTNNITALRKILGPGTIDAIPKHGYRFRTPVVFVPGLSQRASEALREGEIQMLRRTTESVTAARNLFWLVIAEEPGSARAWAWLGRACRFLEKTGIERAYHRQITEAAFQRAFELDPDLPCAHQFFTTFQVDCGKGLAALSRLIRRVQDHVEDAHGFAALVQVCRFCGLLDASERAHQRAIQLDPSIATSIPHTYFARCDYHAVIEAYAEVAQGARGYLDLGAWACLGFKERCEREISRRLSTGALPPIFHALLSSLLFALRGDATEVERICTSQEVYEDPESALLFARHLAFSGCIGSGLAFLRQAIDGGLAIPDMLQCDTWLSPLRSSSEFDLLMKKAHVIQEKGQACLRDAQISQILGAAKRPAGVSVV